MKMRSQAIWYRVNVFRLVGTAKWLRVWLYNSPQYILHGMNKLKDSEFIFTLGNKITVKAIDFWTALIDTGCIVCLFLTAIRIIFSQPHLHHPSISSIVGILRLKNLLIESIIWFHNSDYTVKFYCINWLMFPLLFLIWFHFL